MEKYKKRITEIRSNRSYFKQRGKDFILVENPRIGEEYIVLPLVAGG